MEGVTLLGGEPFEQASALASLAEAAQKAGLSVMTFTGLTYEALCSRNDPACMKLIAHTDLLVDGPYREEEPEATRPYVGSANQRFLFLTDRYTKEEVLSTANRFEIRIPRDGSATVNGMGNLQLLLGTLTRFTSGKDK